MWFNVLKLDLASIQIQGDAEGRNINIDAEDKCRKKLINFQNKMLALEKREKGMSGITHEELRKEVPESIACKYVETIDRYFDRVEVPKFVGAKDTDRYLSNGKFVGPDYDDRGDIDIDEQYGYFNWYRIHNALNGPVISVVFILEHPEHAYHIAFYLRDAPLTNEFKRLWEAS